MWPPSKKNRPYRAGLRLRSKAGQIFFFNGSGFSQVLENIGYGSDLYLIKKKIFRSTSFSSIINSRSMWLKCTVNSFKLLFWHTYKMIQYLDWRLKVIFSYLQTWYYKTNQIPAKFFYRLPQNNNNLYTMYCKFPKIYRKSVLHLLKYNAKLCLSRSSTDLR